MLRLINFEVPEPEINDELENLLQECHRLDIRGMPFDCLILIKLERDNMIRQLALSRYDWTLEWGRDPLSDGFSYLDRDLDKLDILLPKALLESKINQNLFLHQSRVSYFELNFIRLEKYQQDEEWLLKLVRRNEGYEDKDMVYAIDEFRKEDYVRIKEFGAWGLNRIKFIVRNQFIKYDYLLWRANREDIQMNSVRMVVYYLNYKQRRKEIRVAMEELYQQFEEMEWEEILSNIDNNITPSNKEIEQLRFLVSDLSISKKVNLYGENPELPINLHEYIVNYDILIYPHLRQTSDN